MNAIARVAARAWESPLATAFLLGGLAAWFGWLTWSEARDLRDAGHRVQLLRHVVSAHDLQATLRGETAAIDRLADPDNPPFRDAVVIDTTTTHAAGAAIRLEFLFVDAPTPLSGSLADADGKEVLRFTGAGDADRLILDLPLPVGRARWTLRASGAGLRPKAHARLPPPPATPPGPAYQLAPGWVLHESAVATIRRGTGWNAPVALVRPPGVSLRTRGSAALAVRVANPGRHRITLPYERTASDAPELDLRVDGVAVDVVRANDGARTTLTFEGDLPAECVLALHPAAPWRALVPWRPGRRPQLDVYTLRPEDLRIERR